MGTTAASKPKPRAIGGRRAGTSPGGILTVETRSRRETMAWGRRLGLILKGGEVIGLQGDLGSGKTCFVKGIALGLGLDERKIQSPSFTIIREHRGRLPLYHLDLFRLHAVGLDELGLREYLFSEGVAAVEWIEHLSAADRVESLVVGFTYAGAKRRRLEFRPRGSVYAAIVRKLRSGLGS